MALLLNSYKETSEFHKWRLVIEYVHGITIEELARGPPEVDEDVEIFTAEDAFLK